MSNLSLFDKALLRLSKENISSDNGDTAMIMHIAHIMASFAAEAQREQFDNFVKNIPPKVWEEYVNTILKQ